MCADISEMSSIICDMDCDQETNKSIIEKHCSDCLCTGGLAEGNHGFMPARKAWRWTNVVEERGRFNTLSIFYNFRISNAKIAQHSWFPAFVMLKFFNFNVRFFHTVECYHPFEFIDKIVLTPTRKLENSSDTPARMRHSKFLVRNSPGCVTSLACVLESASYWGGDRTQLWYTIIFPLIWEMSLVAV